MTTLHPDLEALMPEPFGYVPFAGEFYPPDELDAEVKNDPTVPAVYTATQMREAILAATERAAAICEQRAVDAPFIEEHYSAVECAAAIRAAAASTGRGEGGEGA